MEEVGWNWGEHLRERTACRKFTGEKGASKGQGQGWPGWGVEGKHVGAAGALTGEKCWKHAEKPWVQAKQFVLYSDGQWGDWPDEGEHMAQESRALTALAFSL